MRELDIPPPPGTPELFALADININILQAALSHIEFTDIEHERLNVIFDFTTGITNQSVN